MPRTYSLRRRIRVWAGILAASGGMLLVAGCTAGPSTTGEGIPTPGGTAAADAADGAEPAPRVTRVPGPPTQAELATCSTLAQVLPDSTKVVQALGDGKAVDPVLLDRVKQGDASLAGMAPENMKPLVANFSRIVDQLEALRSGADKDGASLDTGQYISAVNAFLGYCLDDVGYAPRSPAPSPAP